MVHSVAVVGGGITGLVAAHTLAAQGLEVTVFEARDRLGGQIHTVDFMGNPVDVGAEALHVAGPQVEALLGELGLTEEIIEANKSTTKILTPKGLRPLPTGVGPAGPTRLRPVIASRVLSPLGITRAALEPIIPSGDRSHDVGVGPFITRRFGREVTERLVDPLLGNLHAGDISCLSLNAATPHVATQAQQHRSLLLAQRKRRLSGAPSFISFPGGLTTLVSSLANDDNIAIRLREPVEKLERTELGWRVRSKTFDTLNFDAVLLATPAHRAAMLLRELAPAAASNLDTFRSASVATVLTLYPLTVTQHSELLKTTGVLLPSGTKHLMKAATFLSNKWPQFSNADHMLVRLSAGRVGSDVIDQLTDEDLASRLNAELATLADVELAPIATHVERWPRSLAQLEVGHHDRLGQINAAIRPLRHIVLAGAPYEGIGIASCIRSGKQAAKILLDGSDVRAQ